MNAKIILAALGLATVVAEIYLQIEKNKSTKNKEPKLCIEVKITSGHKTSLLNLPQ